MARYEKSLGITVEPTEVAHTTLQGKTTMTAVRFHGRGDIRLDIVEEPQCGKGDVKVFILTRSRLVD